VSSVCQLALAASRVPRRRWLARVEVMAGLQAAHELMLTDLRASPSVEELAEVANLSPAHFRRAYRDVYGAPPIQYRQRYRLDVAYRMIQRGTPVGKAALAVGYESLPTFSRQFLKRFGKNPSEIRPAIRPEISRFG
jgi:AraC family transcriptional regulator